MFDAQGVADLFVAVATVAAAVFAGWQVRELVRQQREVERLETRAVSVMWQATIAPHKPDAPDGFAVWVLEITLTNPGRMPIDNVHCTIHFDRPVRRLRHDGTTDEPAPSLALEQTVLLGGATRSWTRTIRARFDAEIWLTTAMRATMTFDDMHGNPQTTSWPRRTAQRPDLVAD
ncbi:hypothetical protein ACFT2C_14675 [Promicromonospora sp. NPDC057138]|uniref:hypothetical protein n=1 Tax=Promicromonospora sp. NPDC057138 TaxID=3346031 RepID=UPI00363660E5